MNEDISATLQNVIRNVMSVVGEARFPNRSLSEQNVIASEFAMLEQFAAGLENGQFVITENTDDGDSE